MDQRNLIQNLFRTEYSKLVAVLCKVFGLTHIEIAEDIASDTFLLAAESWGKNGIPDNQLGWLYTVAKNKTRDYLRRKKVRQDKVEPFLSSNQDSHYELDLDFSQPNISDSQLRMIFALCHPTLSQNVQVVLALRILCGFGIEEIASAMLSNKETINKRLYRAKQYLRDRKIELEFPAQDEIQPRLNSVLTTVYLLFNEGYYSSVSSESSLRKDMCLEAMRLTVLLTQNALTNLPQVNALLSLMCFHASRFDARIDKQGAFVLYHDQDRSLWNKDLIGKGEFYLNQSATGEELSKYHLEAAIAYWHTQGEDSEKWENILQLYNYLLQIEYSPIAALNRTYALAIANSPQTALIEAQKLDLSANHLYHCLLAELYRMLGDATKEKNSLSCALKLCKSDKEKELIQNKIKQISSSSQD